MEWCASWFFIVYIYYLVTFLFWKVIVYCPSSILMLTLPFTHVGVVEFWDQHVVFKCMTKCHSIVNHIVHYFFVPLGANNWLIKIFFTLFSVYYYSFNSKCLCLTARCSQCQGLCWGTFLKKDSSLQVCPAHHTTPVSWLPHTYFTWMFVGGAFWNFVHSVFSVFTLIDRVIIQNSRESLLQNF